MHGGHCPWTLQGSDQIAHSNLVDRQPTAVRHEHRRVVLDAELVLAALVGAQITFILQRSEGEHSTTREDPLLAALDGACVGVLQPLLGSLHERTGEHEVGVGAPQQQGRVARHVDVLQGSHEQGAALGSARCPAVEALLGLIMQEGDLGRVRHLRDVARRQPRHRRRHDVRPDLRVPGLDLGQGGRAHRVLSQRQRCLPLCPMGRRQTCSRISRS